MHSTSVLFLLACFYIVCAASFQSRNAAIIAKSVTSNRRGLKNGDNEEDLDAATKKYGLEYGIFKSFGSGDKVKPQELLAKYGAAYLATSISLAIVSYATCFALVSNGIDVASLLSKVGIEVTGVSSTAGTAGIAYIFHKAASPIRFPPTVALTPIVAGWLGKTPKDEGDSTK